MSQTFTERRWTSAGGLSLYARDYAGAAGPAKLPVIAIHGLTRNSADFEGIAPLIAATGRRVLAIDVRGRGRSDRAPDPMTYQPATYAQDVLALLQQAGIEKAVFMGTSMGGLITMALAAIRSKVIAGAIINDVGPEVAKEGLARIAAYSGQPVDTPTWADAAAYAKKINAVAFPHYKAKDWDAFARRIFTGPCQQGTNRGLGLFTGGFAGLSHGRCTCTSGADMLLHVPASGMHGLSFQSHAQPCRQSGDTGRMPGQRPQAALSRAHR